MTDFDRDLKAAIRHFWKTRRGQSQRQGISSGNKDRGGRSAVTGGRQMDGFVSLVQKLLIQAGTPADAIFIRQKLELPGWFRAEKKWDLLVIHDNRLLAAAEFKSQIGPSFGNNFNNRTEEALGSATDLWAAYREGAFKPSPKPWLGYLMLLEDCPASKRPISLTQPHFKVFSEFENSSYTDRYSTLILKLIRDRLYDGACFLTTNTTKHSGNYIIPNPELSFANFITPLIAAVTAAVRKT